LINKLKEASDTESFEDEKEAAMNVQKALERDQLKKRVEVL